MLVIVSDLHLTDGSISETVSPGVFSLFARRLREMAMAASWRTDGSYQPIDRLDIVFLGDVLDVIRSARWAARPSVRPWGNPHTVEFVDQISRITGDILRHNQEGLSVLRALSAEGGLTIPLVARRGSKSNSATQRQPVDVRIHYMVGNADWFYHLPGAQFTAIRQMVVRQMGLSNPADKPLPHDINEDDPLLQAMRRHKVLARHGDLYDPLSFEGDRDASSLSDAVVIDLVNRFSGEVESELINELPASTVLGLREIDDVRPLMMIPVWIDGLLERTCESPAVRKRVKTVWDRLADEFLASEFVRQRDTWSPLDLIDGLERALKFSKRPSIGWADSIHRWLRQVHGAADGSFHDRAMLEQDFRNRRAKHIVYGHTHQAANVPLDASYAEGFVLNQVHFNSGTWRRVHRPTRLGPTEHEFIPADEMTFLAFYSGDERKGRPYEMWSGVLGCSPLENSVHRIDPAILSRAGESISASGQQGHAPHFVASPAHPRSATARRK